MGEDGGWGGAISCRYVLGRCGSESPEVIFAWVQIVGLWKRAGVHGGVLICVIRPMTEELGLLG